MIGKEERFRVENSTETNQHPLSVAFFESLSTLTDSSPDPFRTSRNDSNAQESARALAGKREQRVL